jgi:phenylacetate-CoA ligase
MDALVITCESAADGNDGSARETLSERMKSRYGLTAQIVVVEAGSLPRSEGKAKRVYDHRK